MQTLEKMPGTRQQQTLGKQDETWGGFSTVEVAACTNRINRALQQNELT